jgi:hypothetical protein
LIAAQLISRELILELDARSSTPSTVQQSQSVVDITLIPPPLE